MRGTVQKILAAQCYSTEKIWITGFWAPVTLHYLECAWSKCWRGERQHYELETTETEMWPVACPAYQRGSLYQSRKWTGVWNALEEEWKGAGSAEEEEVLQYVRSEGQPQRYSTGNSSSRTNTACAHALIPSWETDQTVAPWAVCVHLLTSEWVTGPASQGQLAQPGCPAAASRAARAAAPLSAHVFPCPTLSRLSSPHHLLSEQRALFSLLRRTAGLPRTLKDCSGVAWEKNNAV